MEETEVKEEAKLQIHESGLRFFNIPLYSSDGDVLNIRLFESIKPERLEFENNNEYKIRRRFNNNQLKKHLSGYTFWNSKKLGNLTKEKAFKMIEQLTINKNEKDKEI